MGSGGCINFDGLLNQFTISSSTSRNLPNKAKESLYVEGRIKFGGLRGLLLLRQSSMNSGKAGNQCLAIKVVKVKEWSMCTRAGEPDHIKLNCVQVDGNVFFCETMVFLKACFREPYTVRRIYLLNIHYIVHSVLFKLHFFRVVLGSDQIN